MKYLVLVLCAFSFNGKFNRMINFEKYSGTFQSSMADPRWRSLCRCLAVIQILAGAMEPTEVENAIGLSRTRTTRESFRPYF